jgi:hypothetical protein
MSKKAEVILSDAVARMVENQVASGRYTDFSSAIQDAAWNYFIGTPSIYEEYGVTPEEVDKAYQRERKKIVKAKKMGTLKRWE